MKQENAAPPMRLISWQEFDEAVDAIAEILKPHSKGRSIYGAARGGLPLAVALSHKLDIPLILFPRAHTIWVDDIYDSGATHAKAQEFMSANTIFVVWFIREKMLESEGSIYYHKAINDDWLVFPWEDKENAAKDKAEYDAKNK